MRGAGDGQNWNYCPVPALPSGQRHLAASEGERLGLVDLCCGARGHLEALATRANGPAENNVNPSDGFA